MQENIFIQHLHSIVQLNIKRHYRISYPPLNKVSSFYREIVKN